MNLSSKFKGQLVSITLVLALFIVGANVFVVSVIGYHINSKQSIKDAVTGVQEETNILHAKRGNILDRNGSVLAQDVISYSLYAILDSNRLNSDQSPAYVFDPEGTKPELEEDLSENLVGIGFLKDGLHFNNASQPISLTYQQMDGLSKEFPLQPASF